MTERRTPNHDQEPNPKEAALAKFEAMLTDQVWHGHPVRRLKFRSTDLLYKGKQSLPYDYVQISEHINIVNTSKTPTPTENKRYLRISEYDGVDSEMRHVKLATHYNYDYQTGHLEFSQIVSPDSYVSAEQTRKFIEEQPELYPSYQIAEEGDYEDNEVLWEYLNSLADSLAAHSKYTAEATAELQRTMQELGVSGDDDLRRLGILPGIGSRQLDLTKDLEGFDTRKAIAIGLAASKGMGREVQGSSPELAHLPAELGFIETDELTSVRQRLLDAFASGDPESQIPHLSDLYHAAGQEELEKIEGTETERFTKGQIGFIIAQANIYHVAGQFGLYRSLLNDALTYADNMRYEEVAAQIQAALDNIPKTEEDQMTSEVTSSELALALADTLPEETCQAISEMDLEDALGFAFEELLGEGVEDPEEFLKEKGILE